MFDLLWTQISGMFPILNGKFDAVPNLPAVSRATIENISRQLNEWDIDAIKSYSEIIELEIQSAVRSKITPRFWKHFSLDEESSKLVGQDISQTTSTEFNAVNQKLFDKFVAAVEELFVSFEYMLELLERVKILIDCGKRDNEAAVRTLDVAGIQQLYKECLLAQLPPQFDVTVNAFCWINFRVFAKIRRDNIQNYDSDGVFNDMQCSGCNLDAEKCCCKTLYSMINTTNGKLLQMDLMDRIAGTAMSTLVKMKITDHISETCQGIFDRSHLKQLEIWLENVIIVWLTKVYSSDSLDQHSKVFENKSIIESFKVKLTYFMYEKFAHSVVDQFFSIIIDFPDSTPAIDDLKICMEKIDMRVYLTQTLRTSLEARILHPGVNTMDILTGYVAAIKAIRHLDNSGVILEMVTAPIKDYLRKRSDTVRCVVTGLTEEGPTDLSEELAKGEMIKENKEAAGSDELNNWENWQPDPFGIDPSILRNNNSKVMRSADIISMVVDIYGSKELFMLEYRNLMADRLLTQLDFNSEKEIRNLELLKIRFGDTLLHSCEVMLKDVTDSKRINSHIHCDSNYKESKTFDVSSLIISAQFWPSFNKESLELPEEIEEVFKKYTKSYEAYKVNRTLSWRTVTGRVNIVIEIGERTLEMVVPPTQAVIIYHFQHKSEWALEELSALIKVPATALRRRISFWQNHGLISETRPGVFKLMEEEAEKGHFEDMNVTENDEDVLESAMASASDQREEELQVFWSYIVGMLTNLDSLPIERIHQMLKLFASHGGGVEFTQEELKHFLQRKVREHKLLFSGGVYQLAK